MPDKEVEASKEQRRLLYSRGGIQVFEVSDDVFAPPSLLSLLFSLLFC
jgi:hypothetical protein